MLLRVGLAGLGFNLLHGLDVQLTVISPGLARWLGMVLRHLPGMWPWIQAMPVWVRWLWVVGAWSAVLGSVLMLLMAQWWYTRDQFWNGSLR
ncbi:MAG TPA: hypothetical protein VN222_13355 [Novosphingobium sp.]|nr:hypothetical protein [Novosphingobium sp.]